MPLIGFHRPGVLYRSLLSLFAIFLLLTGVFQPGNSGTMLLYPLQSFTVVAQKPPPPTPPSGSGSVDLPASMRCPAPRWIVKLNESAGQVPSDQAVVEQFGNNAALSLSLAAGMEISFVREMSGGALVFEAAPVPGLDQPAIAPAAPDTSFFPVGECITQEQALAVAAAWSSLPQVAYAEPDSLRSIASAPGVNFTPNDTHYTKQWSLFNPVSGSFGINAPSAWELTQGDSRVVVAVIDTDITDHFDLQGRFLPGFDFISDAWIANDGGGRDNDAHDPGDWVYANACGPGSQAQASTWHGTHVAGTIGAVGDNAAGVAGINWISPILPVRVLGRCGGYTSDIVDGMRWAAGLAVPGVPPNPYKAQVLNLSLSGLGACSQTERDAIQQVTAAGSTVVVAAGNESADASGYAPANCPGVITVAATERYGSRAYYSNYGSTVELSAPGGDVHNFTSDGVLSTLNTGLQGPVADTYAYYQGTSMAVPYVTGVASLLYSLSPTLTPSQVLQILRDTATAFPAGSTCSPSICGSGIVNAGAALSVLPRLTSLSPAGANLGKSLILTVNGVSFNSSYKIVWDGVPRTTTFLSSTQLSTQLTPSDLVSSGVVQVSVSGSHPIYGSITTSSLVFSVGLDHLSFLPQVAKSLLYSPSLLYGVLVNGNFEADSMGWIAYSSSGFQMIRTSFPYSIQPVSGLYAAWLGGFNYESDYLQQTVVVDPAFPYLSYSDWIYSDDYCGYDFASIWVDGFQEKFINLCQLTNTYGWVRESLDLSKYAGKTIALRIGIETDYSIASSWFLDDLAFSASP